MTVLIRLGFNHSGSMSSPSSFLSLTPASAMPSMKPWLYGLNCRWGAEVWTSFGRQVTSGEIVLIRDESLIGLLTTRKSVFDSRGRIGIEKKDDLRSRGLHSPDRADAVVRVFGVRNAYAGHYTKATRLVDSADPYTHWDSWGQSGSGTLATCTKLLGA